MGSLRPGVFKSLISQRSKPYNLLLRRRLRLRLFLPRATLARRTFLSQWWDAMMKNLRGSGKCGCIAHRRLYGECVFVFACFSQLSRTERIRSLKNLVDAALYRYQGNESLGVAYDADDDDSGFDVLLWRGVPVVNADIARLADAVFGPPETQIADPFGEARPYSPPHKSS
jgi:hypothetical protein